MSVFSSIKTHGSREGHTLSVSEIQADVSRVLGDVSSLYELKRFIKHTLPSYSVPKFGWRRLKRRKNTKSIRNTKSAFLKMTLWVKCPSYLWNTLNITRQWKSCEIFIYFELFFNTSITAWFFLSYVTWAQNWFLLIISTFISIFIFWYVSQSPHVLKRFVDCMSYTK